MTQHIHVHVQAYVSHVHACMHAETSKRLGEPWDDLGHACVYAVGLVTLTELSVSVVAGLFQHLRRTRWSHMITKRYIHAS